MKFLLLDKYKLMIHTVNSDQEESLLINYDNRNLDSTKIISLEKENSEWYVKSNGIVIVFNNGVELDKYKLSPNTICQLKILGSDEELFIYAETLTEKEIKSFTYSTLETLTLGKGEKNIIQYNYPMINDNHFEIVKKDNNWILNSLNNSIVYHNDIRVESKKLELGDIIYVYGLKIVWMGNFFSIFTDSNQLKMNSVHVQNYLFEKYPITDTNSQENLDLDLYTEDDYFYHIARFVNVVEEEEVKIDSVPQAKEIEERPALLTLGSSLTMIVSAFLNAYKTITSILSGEKTWNQSIPAIIMTFSLIFGSLIMPRIVSMYQKSQIKQYQKKRKRKYTKYLQKKEDEIVGILSKQTQMLRDNNVSLSKCIENITLGRNNVWDRELKDDDFLCLSLGVGNVPSSLKISAPEEHFVMEEDDLEQQVFEVVNKSRMLNDVPVVIDLIEKRIVSVINESDYYDDFIKATIIQLISHYSPNDLKIVFFTDEEGNRKWSDLKYLPHLWNEDKSMRFFSSNINERKKISAYFETELKDRKEKLSFINSDKEEGNEDVADEEVYKKFNSYYLIICDNYPSIKDLPIIETILKSNKNYGFSFLIFERGLRRVPNFCTNFVYLNKNEGVLFDKKLNDKRQISFKPDYDINMNFRSLINSLSNIPIVSGEGKYELPTSLTFLDMFGVSKIEQLNILNRWNTNNPTQSLASPIGVHKNGDLFMLDLHEKAHGPHGLIAGSTGSGKSEFIISFITSMAINFHPNDVQFVLIDYKGGGLAGAFENREKGLYLPHLAGTITNLDVSEMNRTLVSIKSELQRRQKTFNTVKDQLGESTIDIYKYQKFYKEGLIKEPIAHLFIISDEFAELKAQQPDFMQELISTARIGRSLGVHLILATQKPSGVVNDQIWSNSKFKICLKVQDRSDSMEMLKKPDAASIKEAGRFYLQVGYDEYFDIGQSGYSGAKYTPTDKVSKKNDDSVNFVDNVGMIYKSTNSIVPIGPIEEKGDQLTNLVRFLVALGAKENIKIRKMWLDAIPEKIYLSNLAEKYGFKPESYNINPIIGEYDDPKKQMQGLLTLDFTNGGNTIIWGMPGSGKENLISTILFSIITTHTPQEVNMYVIDLGAESLRSFRRMPHVGDVAFVDDAEKILNMLIMIEKEYEKRKELFADYAGSYNNYTKNTNDRLPQIIIFINNYDVFLENYAKLGDGLGILFRDSYRYGIFFVLTCLNGNTVRSKLLQYFNNKISLKMPEPTEYRNLLGSEKSLVPANYFGRGVVKLESGCYEFQTASFVDLDNMNNYLKVVSEKLLAAYNYKVRGIPVMPEKVTIDFLASEIKDITNIPIGVDKDSLDIVKFNFSNKKVIPILSNNNIMLIDFIHPIAKMIATLKNTKVKIIDPTLTYKTLTQNVEYIDTNFDVELDKIINQLKTETQNIFIFVGISMMYKKLSANSKKKFANFIENYTKYANNYVIISDLYENYKTIQMESWVNKVVDKRNGMWLGPGVGTQMCITFDKLTVDDRKIEFPDMCFTNIDGKKMLIKNVVEDEGEQNEK